MEYCIVYLSSTKALLSEEDLLAIVRHSQVNNRAWGITGILLYFNGSIIQVLEGDQQRVTTLYEVISRDSRHGQLICLYKGPIERRSFGDWLMGYKTLSAVELDSLGDLLPVAGSPTLAVGDEPNPVLRLVQIFYQTNYRN